MPSLRLLVLKRLMFNQPIGSHRGKTVENSANQEPQKNSCFRSAPVLLGISTNQEPPKKPAKGSANQQREGVPAFEKGAVINRPGWAGTSCEDSQSGAASKTGKGFGQSGASYLRAL